jgi:hypothetical protein
VLEGVLVSAVLEALTGEVLPVVSQRQMVPRRDLVVGLQEEDVLILLAVPVERELLEARDAGRRVRIARCTAGDVQDDGVRGRVALAVVVRKEEEAILDDRSTEARSELIEVISRFRTAVDDVDVVLRLDVLVPVEVEGTAVEIVRA